MSKEKKIITQYRKASFNFEIIDKIEVGIVLNGSEVKAIRQNKVSLDSSYAAFKSNEIWIMNLHIDIKNFDIGFDSTLPARPRKILIKRGEIDKISLKIKNNGYTLVPLDLHFNLKGFIKVLLGISKGRKKQDLREYKKQQDWKRDKERLKRI